MMTEVFEQISLLRLSAILFQANATRYIIFKICPYPRFGISVRRNPLSVKKIAQLWVVIKQEKSEQLERLSITDTVPVQI